MTQYRIRITETSSRLETVEADCEENALDYVQEQYTNENIVLDSSDYDDVRFEVD